MRKFITEKNFYMNIIKIMLPIVLQNIITFSVSLMDTIMVGQLGDVAISAVAQATQPGFIFQLIIFGLACGGAVLCSQYWGKGDTETIRKIVGIVIRITITISIFVSLLVCLFPEVIMNFYLDTSNAEGQLILEEAVNYLRIIMFTYLLFGLSFAFTTVMRSVEIVKAAVFSSLIAFISNVFFNWVFIFGNLGAPKMGVRGAALGTLLARIFEFTAVMIYVFAIDKRLKFRIKYIFKREKKLSKDFTRVSIPVMLNELMWGVGMSVQAAVIGNISKTFLAANSIVSIFQQFATIVSFGVANAAMVAVGKKIGEGDMQGARSASSTLMIWSVILGFFSAIIVFFSRGLFVSFFNVTEETRLVAENMLMITSVVVFFSSISITGIVGVLRGAGDAKFALAIEFVALWIIAIPFGAVSGLIFEAPVYLVYFFLRIDEPLKSVIAYIRSTRASTYRVLTR